MEKKYVSKMMGLYKMLTSSDLKGHIDFEENVRNLYIFLCIDKASNRMNFEIPEIAYAGFAKEIARVYDECYENYIDGDDYSNISYYRLTFAFLEYFQDVNKRLSEIDKISSYDLAKEVVKYLGQ